MRALARMMPIGAPTAAMMRGSSGAVRPKDCLRLLDSGGRVLPEQAVDFVKNEHAFERRGHVDKAKLTARRRYALSCHQEKAKKARVDVSQPGQIENE